MFVKRGENERVGEETSIDNTNPRYSCNIELLRMVEEGDDKSVRGEGSIVRGRVTSKLHFVKIYNVKQKAVGGRSELILSDSPVTS